MKRRILAMLLAIVMLAGNVPVHAFATEPLQPEAAACTTEGCEYAAGHEDNCSNYTAPAACTTEGCEYAAGHEGNCSNYTEPEMPEPDALAAGQVSGLIDAIGPVTLESEQAILAADQAFAALTDDQKALVANASVLADAKAAYLELSAVPEPASTAAEPATVTVSVSDHGVLALAQAEITVADLNEDGLLSYDEAMVVTHELYCPGGYETHPHPEFNLTVGKLWGSGDGGTANILTFTNDVCNVLNLGETYIQEGDHLFAAVLKDDFAFNDWYTFFTQKEQTVNAGEEFTLTLQGFQGMAWGEVIPVPISGVTIGTWEETSLTSLDATTNESGEITLSFDQPGTYVISADGTVWDEMYFADCPIIPPVCVVTVNAAPVPVEGISLSRDQAELDIGDTLELTYSITPGNADNQNVSWSTSEETVATVANGMVTAHTAGTATITATTVDGGKTAQCVVTVREPAVASITLDQTAVTMTLGGEPVALKAAITPESAAGNTVTWKSSNLAVAQVDDKGVVTAVAAGEAVITAFAGDKSADCQVTVQAAQPPVSGGITIETNQEGYYPADFYLSEIVLQDLTGTVSGSGNDWEVELAEGTDMTRPITVSMKSSLGAVGASQKGTFCFYADSVLSEKTLAEVDPGTVTFTPNWEDGRASVTLGICNAGNQKKMGTPYRLELSVKGAVVDNPNKIKLEEAKEKKYFARSFEISGAQVLASTISNADYSGSTSGHKATIDVELTEMPQSDFELIMTMMLLDDSYVTVNGGSRQEISEGVHSIAIDLKKMTSYQVITYSTKSSGTVRGTYTINFTVAGVDTNAAPMLKDAENSETKAEIIAGEAYALNLAPLFTDANGDSLTYTVQINGAAPAAAAANYQLTPDEPGDYTLIFRANDGKADSQDCYTVHLTVQGNTPPVINGEASAAETVRQYSPWSIDLSKVFADKEGELTYRVYVNGGAAAAANAAYSYTPETAGTHTLVFRAVDTSGAESPAFTVTLTVEAVPRAVIDTTCTGGETGDTWVKSITVTGAEIQVSAWNAESGHSEGETHILNIELNKDTADDAVIALAYTPGYASSGFQGSISGPASLTLQDGKGSVTVTTRGWLGNGTARTYLLKFSNKPNTAPVASAATAEQTLGVGEEFRIDLKEIFSDADEDILRYTVTAGGSETAVDETYSQIMSSSGTHTLVFTAYDSWGASATHTVTVTAKVSEKTYAVTVKVPKGITPAFYVTGAFDGEKGDTLGDALTAEAGDPAGGFVPYQVAVPESISRISFRGRDTDGNDWGGMTAAVSANMDPVVLVQLTAVIPSKVSGTYVTADQALFRLADKDGHYAVSGGTHTDKYGIVCYRFLVHAMGTDDLGKAYTTYVVPQGSLTGKYITTIGSNKTFTLTEPQQTTQLTMTLKSSFSITAPDGAVVRMFQQNNYYNSPEIPVTETVKNADGTTTWIFEKGDSSRTTYRVSMEGKITKAGYVSGDRLTVDWSESDDAPDCRRAYNTSALFGARGDDSLVLNVNGRNNLVMNSGSTFRLRAYRIWEIINSDTGNIMIQPDMTWELTGDDIVTVTPVTAGTGNGQNNWLDLQADGSGVAYLEVGYDALQILTGNTGSFGGDAIGGFTFNACDPARTGLVVIQTGNAATDVDFGIHCSSTQNGSAVSWDAEFDTLYFTGSSGQLTLTPSVSSGAVAGVAVSGDKGVSWTELMSDADSYTADIGCGNHVIRITKNDGTQAYQVVRGDRVSVGITQTSGDDDGVVEPGESFRVQLHGVHNPIGKMSGNYNPGYQHGQHLTYRFNGAEVSTSGVYQYDFVSNAWVNVTIPETAQDGDSYTLTNGYIRFNVFGVGDVTSNTENHRGIGDGGCTTRGSGSSMHQRSLLPEITLTVGRNTDGSDPAVAVTAVSLNKTETTLAPKETLTLTATVTPENATDKTVTWTSSNTAVATVSDGTVTAVAEGTAEITAAVGEKTAVCTITVADSSIAVTGITLSHAEAELETGDTLTLTATVTPEDATDKTVTWTSSNTAVAAVSGGTVTARAEGTAVITAAAGDVSATCTVTVTEPEGGNDPGEDERLGTVTISFEDRAIRLESDLSGMDNKFKNPLGTIVSATEVEIAEPYETIADVTLRLLDSFGMTYNHEGTTKSGFYLASIGSFTVNGTAYSSFGEFDAGSGSGWMITRNGEFIGRGASDFTVEDGDVIRWQYTCQLGADIGGGGATGGGTEDGTGEDSDTTVTVTGITLNKTSLSLKVNGSETLTATVSPANATEKKVTWRSDNTGVATVDSNGKVTGKKTGSANITATAGGKTATCKVTVSSASASGSTSTGTGSKNTSAANTAATAASLIRALPTTIKAIHEKQVLAAIDAYDALTDAQKKTVDKPLVARLEEAKVKLAKIMTTEQEQKAASELEKQIGELGEITLDSEDKIQRLRASYEKLSRYQKYLISNADKLTEAEAALATLKALSDPKTVCQATGDYLSGLGTPGVGAVGGEWMVIGLARSGREVPAGYYDHVLTYVKTNINDAEQLHSAKSSDNSRLILALTAIGRDVTDVGGHNLLKGLSDMDYIRKQGINGPIWALLAFDSGNYPAAEGNVSREALMDVILEAQLGDGGWALSGERSDPDMTGMAIQALAPYVESDRNVKKAVENAIRTLSEMQNDDGSFSSVDGPNSESIAQVIVALSALGIDADTDARFVKKGCSALDALLTYFIPGGGFRHVQDSDLDGMSTEQAYYALVAYDRMKQNQSFLYDMTDVIDRGGDVVVEEITEPAELPAEPVEEEKEDGKGTVIGILAGVMTLCAGGIAVILLNRKRFFG